MSERQVHFAPDDLQRRLHGELPPSQAAAVERHLAACAECRALADEVASAEGLLRQYHDALKFLDPAPPRAWTDLRPRLEELETSTDSARGRNYSQWLAVAAALLLGLFLYYRMEHPARVSAAELLRKASEAAPALDPARRIRIRTGRQSLVRPAILRGIRPASEDRTLETLFASARYNWDDPLSARSYADWRDRLHDKSDRVATVTTPDDPAGLYEIHTTTSSNALTEAVLFLRIADLHPVRELMHFGADTVEITETGDPLTSLPAVTAPVAAKPVAPPPPPSIGPAEELRVIAALHRIGADLGDPVEVARENNAVVVKGTGLTPQREAQVRDAVAEVAGTVVRFDEPGADRLGVVETRRVDVAAASRTELGSRLGEDTVNRILDASEAVMARAYALRALARRFPPPVEAALPEADRRLLGSLRSEHSIALGVRLRELETNLARVVPRREPPTVLPPPDWQAGVARLFTAAQQVDTLLNGMLAGSDDPGARLPELAEALGQLDAEARP